MFEVFRSKEYIRAIYFDGSLEVAMVIAKAFPSRVQLEFTGGESFILRVTSQASIIVPHTYVYLNKDERLEWRDTAELEVKWDKWDKDVPATPKRKRK